MREAPTTPQEAAGTMGNEFDLLCYGTFELRRALVLPGGTAQRGVPDSADVQREAGEGAELSIVPEPIDLAAGIR